MRLDKWLWAARFFKTRSLAADAIKGGKVALHGQRVKPGKEIQPGAILKIRQGVYIKEINVCDLSQQRGPAPKAQLLYKETEQSLKANADLKEQLKNQATCYPKHKGRPNKRDRQKIIQFNQKVHTD